MKTENTIGNSGTSVVNTRVTITEDRTSRSRLQQSTNQRLDTDCSTKVPAGKASLAPSFQLNEKPNSGIVWYADADRKGSGCISKAV